MRMTTLQLWFSLYRTHARTHRHERTHQRNVRPIWLTTALSQDFRALICTKAQKHIAHSHSQLTTNNWKCHALLMPYGASVRWLKYSNSRTLCGLLKKINSAPIGTGSTRARKWGKQFFIVIVIFAFVRCRSSGSLRHHALTHTHTQPLYGLHSASIFTIDCTSPISFRFRIHFHLCLQVAIVVAVECWWYTIFTICFHSDTDGNPHTVIQFGQSNLVVSIIFLGDTELYVVLRCRVHSTQFYCVCVCVLIYWDGFVVRRTC